jgi:uncharacterized membrane protein YeiB
MQIAVLVYGVVGLVTVMLDAYSSIWALYVQISVFAVLAVIGVLLQVFVKQYSSCLSRKSEDKSDIIKFAFTFGALAQFHLANYRAKSRKRAVFSESFQQVPDNSAASVQAINLESIVLAV